VRSRSLMCLLTLAATTSCLDGSAPGPDCSDDVQVTVGTGLTPEISWRPSCLAGGLVVEALDGSGHMWIVNTGDWIAPPIFYGTLPPGAVASGPRPLVAGSVYRVLVLAAVDIPGVGTRVRVVGTAEFTP
jgi:hypothetical protein